MWDGVRDGVRERTVRVLRTPVRICETGAPARLVGPKLMCKEVALHPVSSGELLRVFEHGNDTVLWAANLSSKIQSEL